MNCALDAVTDMARITGWAMAQLIALAVALAAAVRQILISDGGR